jgi:hypothetical protein
MVFVVKKEKRLNTENTELTKKEIVFYNNKSYLLFVSFVVFVVKKRRN